MTDELVRGVALGGKVRIMAVRTTEIARRLREVHDAGPWGAMALGRAASALLLMGATIKDRQQIGLQINGDGPLGEIYGLADAEGQVRVTVARPRGEPDEKFDTLRLASAIGFGRFAVMKKLAEDQAPYRGIIPIVSGEIAQDLAEYYLSSEQIPSAVALGERLDTDGIEAAGGYLIQALPGADADELDAVLRRIASLPPLGDLFAMGIGPASLLDRLFDDAEVLATTAVKLHCPCSREQFARRLCTIGEEELRKLTEADEEIVTECQFCRATHAFDREQINALLYGARMYDKAD